MTFDLSQVWRGEVDHEDLPPHQSEELPPKRFLFLLALALLAAFPKVAFGFRTFFYRDFGAMWYPVYFYTRRSLLHGHIPLWNPYIHCGVPFQAQMGQWYPPLLLGTLLPMPWALNFMMLAHLLWAGFGMYWLARRWGCSAFAASFAGMAYAFNGVMLSSLLWSSYITSLAWLPWVVGCVAEAWKHGGRWLIRAVLCSALQVLTGMPEIIALTWLLIGLLWLISLSQRQTRFVPSVGRLALLVLLAAGISMIQMLPFFDLISHSQRNQNTATAEWSMPQWGWANLLVPLFHCYRAPTGLWFQSNQDLLPSYYIGLAVLSLGLVAPIFARTRITLALCIVAISCWLMALGPSGFVYSWLRKLIPVLGIMRFPVKFTILPAFLLPLLAAWTIHRFQSCSRSQVLQRCLTFIGVPALVLIAGLLWYARQYPLETDRWDLTAWNALVRAILMVLVFIGLALLSRIEIARYRLLLQIAILALLPLDAMTHSPNIAPTLPASVLAPGAWQSSGKPEPPKIGQGRIMLTPQAEQQLLFSRVHDLQLDFTGKRLAEWYNFNLLDNIPKVNGAMPLRPADFDRIEQAIYFASGTHIGPGLFDFLSVAAYSPPENPLLWLPRTNCLPLMTGGQVTVFASDEQTLKAITSDDFDPRMAVYLSESDRSSLAISNAATVSFQNTRFTPQEIETDTESSAPGIVVLSQSFYHLWQASVDDQPAPLLRANLAFQAVPIPSGKHHLKLVYRDLNFTIGAVLSLLSLAICAWLWFRTKPRPAP